MRFLLSVAAAVALLATSTAAHSGKDRIVWHERPVKEQHGCIVTCKKSSDKPSEFLRTQCAVCMDRIRNTVCADCAAAYRDGVPFDKSVDRCYRCRHVSDYDSSSEFDEPWDKDGGFFWPGPEGPEDWKFPH